MQRAGTRARSRVCDSGHSDHPTPRPGWEIWQEDEQSRRLNPAGEDGETLATPKNVKLPVKVSIGEIDAPLIYALVVYTGEIQVAARVPDGVRVRDMPLALTVDKANSRGDVTIADK
jgi:hypothetical protein